MIEPSVDPTTAGVPADAPAGGAATDPGPVNTASNTPAPMGGTETRLHLSILMPRLADATHLWVQVVADDDEAALPAPELAARLAGQAMIRLMVDMPRLAGDNRWDLAENALVAHARRELELCGQAAESPEYAGSVLAAVATLAAFGHSGGSMGAACRQLAALFMYRPLSPITNNPADWIDVAEYAPGVPLWQCRRDSRLFSRDGGVTYWNVDDRGGPNDTDRLVYTAAEHTPTTDPAPAPAPDPAPVDVDVAGDPVERPTFGDPAVAAVMAWLEANGVAEWVPSDADPRVDPDGATITYQAFVWEGARGWDSMNIAVDRNSSQPRTEPRTVPLLVTPPPDVEAILAAPRT